MSDELRQTAGAASGLARPGALGCRWPRAGRAAHSPSSVACPAVAHQSSLFTHHFPFTVALLLAAAPVWPLTSDDLPQLVAMDDRIVATMAAPELNWSGDGACLVVAGKGAGGVPTVSVVPVDGRPALTLPPLVSPYLAFSPGGPQIACWVKGPAGPTGNEMARLALYDPQLRTATPLEGIGPFEATSRIVWLSDPERIVALRPRQGLTALVIFDPTTGLPAPLTATVAGLGTVLCRASAPNCVVVGAVGTDGLTEYYLVDVITGVVSNAPPEDLPGSPAASALSPGRAPGGALVASSGPDGLWVGTPGKPTGRRLLPPGDQPGHEFISASQPTWSPTGEYLAYSLRAPGAEGAEIHLAALGLEEIVCEIRYQPGGVTPALGATVWACMALRPDPTGGPVEPDWKTLKAQLSVTSSPLMGPEGLLLRARNVGLQGGVLKRLTGMMEPPAGSPDIKTLKMGPAGGHQQVVMYCFALPPRAGLLAWSQGTSTGHVTSVSVTRRALMLIGGPAG